MRLLSARSGVRIPPWTPIKSKKRHRRFFYESPTVRNEVLDIDKEFKILPVFKGFLIQIEVKGYLLYSVCKHISSCKKGGFKIEYTAFRYGKYT